MGQGVTGTSWQGGGATSRRLPAVWGPRRPGKQVGIASQLRGQVFGRG